MSDSKTKRERISRIRKEVIVCCIIALATFTVYFQVINHEFIIYDDGTYVTKNPHVNAGFTLKSVCWAFTSTRASNWHPVTWLSHMLDVQIFGMDSGSHHLMNLLFHMANVMLLFLVFRMMTGDLWKSGFLAALFALHPLHVESVAWVSERKDVLSTFFWLLTMWAYFWYARAPGINRYLLVILIFVLGLMAKPMLVTLPFVLLLMDYWPLRRFQLAQPGGGAGKQYNLAVSCMVLEKLPLFVLAAGSSLVTFYVQKSGGAVGSFEVYPLASRIGNAFVSYVTYLGKTIWPFNLAAIYPYPKILPLCHAIGAGFLLFSISLFVLKLMKLRPYLTVGWLWYIGTLVPVIGLVQIGTQAMADRYTYVPLIGIFLIVAWGVADLLERWPAAKITVYVGSVTLLSVLAAGTWLQVQYWKNSIRLFEHSLSVTENNYMAHSNLGIALASKGDVDRAAAHLYEAIRINPRFVEAYNNLGVVKATQDKMTEAINYFSEGLRINPRYADAHYNLGNILANQGKTDEAIKHYLEAIRINPGFAKAHFSLGNALSEKGEKNEAIRHYFEALRINPKYAAAHNNLGVILVRAGKIDEAITHFRKALKIMPDHVNAAKNLEKALAATKKMRLPKKTGTR